MIEYTERVDGEHLYARVDFDDGTWMEVPINGLSASEIQAKLEIDKQMHQWFLENMPSEP